MNTVRTLEQILEELDAPDLNPLGQTCKRKFVRCIVARHSPSSNYINEDGKLSSKHDRFVIQKRTTNQLQHQKGLCTGEQSKCGCMHAEPKCIIDLIKAGYEEKEFILFCNYSPCDACANLIGYSGLFKLVVYKQFAPNWPHALGRLKSFDVKQIQLGFFKSNVLEQITNA